MTVLVVVRVAVPEGSASPAAKPVEHAQAEDADPDGDDEQRRDQVHPRVELLGNDELRQRERDQAEGEDADRVRDRDDPAQVEGMARRPARPDEVGGDDRLSVPRAERVGRPPEHRQKERDGDDRRAQIVFRDQARKPALGSRRHAGRCLELPAVDRRRCTGGRARRELRGRRGDIERALEEILRIGAQLVARRGRADARRLDGRARVGRRDDDLLPAEAIPVVPVAVGKRPAAVRNRAGLDDELEPRRIEPAYPLRERERPVELRQLEPLPVHRQRQVGDDLVRERGPVGLLAEPLHLALGLERRDLGQVEHVHHVDPVTGRLDAAVLVDREVPERVSRRQRWDEQDDDHGEEQEQALHAISSLAIGAWMKEKLGLISSALPRYSREASSLPTQRSIMPRWKSITGSRVPRRSALTA